MREKRIVLMALVLFFYSCWIVFAETIYLKTGKKIRGQIVEKNDKQIKVDISGVKITYYMDEIDHIEGAGTTPTPPDAAQANPSVGPSPAVKEQKISPSEDTDVKKVLIMDLIDASGTKETMSQMFSQIIAQAPPDQVASLKSVLDVNEIIPRLVPVYDKYFTEDELKELIAFYKGATGRKLIKVMPSIMEDSMKATESYFQEKMPAPENQKK